MSRKEELLRSITETEEKLKDLKEELNKSDHEYKPGDFVVYCGDPYICLHVDRVSSSLLLSGKDHHLHSGGSLTDRTEWILHSPFAGKCFWRDPTFVKPLVLDGE